MTIGSVAAAAAAGFSYSFGGAGIAVTVMLRFLFPVLESESFLLDILEDTTTRSYVRETNGSGVGKRCTLTVQGTLLARYTRRWSPQSRTTGEEIRTIS